jgi:NAD(P)-dependent dehydrogenase (short-subunit alcohol dehydrogenase family)
MASNKIAIVTGGNRGIGHEIARQLMKADLFVVIGARDPAKCEIAVAALKPGGANVAGFPLDVNDTKSVRRFVEHVEKHHGAPGVLVNNAGVYPESTEAKVVDTPTSTWRETLETNLFGAVRMCREVVPLMQKLRYGRIVNMSSGMGQLHQMGAGAAAYRTSKAALNAFTCTLAAEVAGTGILVNSMSPGWVRTDMGGDEAPRSVEEGADTAVWLSLLPSSGPSGRFFRDRQPIPW